MVALVPTQRCDELVESTREFVIAAAAHLVKSVFPKNPRGFTWCPFSWSTPTFAEDVWLVSLDGFELISHATPQETQIRAWLRTTLPRLFQPCTYVGAWRDPSSELLYLDLSVAIRGARHAHSQALAEKQQFIYHPATDTCIPVVVPTRRRRAA